MLSNYDVMVIFEIYNKFGAIQEPDSACMVYNP